MAIADLWQPRSLVWRLTVAYLAIFLAFLGIAFMALYFSIRAVIDYRIDDDLIEDIEEFRLSLSRDGVNGVKEDMWAETESGEHDSVIIQLFDASKTLVHSTSLEYWTGLDIDMTLLDAARDEPQLFSHDLPNQEAETRFGVGMLDEHYFLVIGESMEERDELIEMLSTLFSLVFIPAMLIAAALSHALVRRVISGIRRVSDVALAIHRGHLDRRVLAEGEVEEVQQLADTFDAMAARVEKLVVDMRDMTDNIAHDMRSPLTRVRILAESALQDHAISDHSAEAAKAIIGECDRLRNLINLSLDVSEAEAGISRQTAEIVDIGLMLDDLAELYEPLALERGQLLHCHIEGTCMVNGERVALQRMLGNIIDNAIKYAKDDSSIHVTAETDNASVVISVSNRGDGIEADHISSIFDRYYRADPSRSGGGSGLGLSYSRAVSRLHGGDITVSSDPGELTRFSINLPRYRDGMAVSPVIQNDDRHPVVH